jgi:uncharacterized protein (TIGR02594 family)
MLKPLPPSYQWLAQLDAPRIIDEALQLYGVRETAGPLNTPAIMGWAGALGVAKAYVADAVPWCGLFVGIVVKRAGWTPVDGPLWARNWAKFGKPSPEPGLGDVLVFAREGGGHVGFYIAEDATTFHVLGGNQGDAVSIARIAKARLVAARRPIWRLSRPASVKRYVLGAGGGALSHNEA